VKAHGGTLVWRGRAHRGFAAFVIHRVSGLLLALFLPLHFWALGTALEGAARLDSFLRWTDHPLVKAAELGLVVLLAAHLAGGVRLMLLEFGGWRDWQQRTLAATIGLALVAGLLFLLNLGA
jgi:fumarate reductase subunit D